ncbi:MAG: sterol desaturase family protein [Ignavibacteriales bacterium]|nr:sterol desaturase family protein [Ignavibacteriales bacterium]MCF8316722.1 sterol desaturase family protein [Ignavibacteriales bacterium]MCF8436044.1 sterol desaturase family protein [Ignavibacteriales bacterium]
MEQYLISVFSGLSGTEIISYGLIIFSAFIFVLLERFIPYNKGQKLFRDGFFDDLAFYTIAQNYILSIIIFSVIFRVFQGSGNGASESLLDGVPIWIQLLFFTVSHDFYIYWMHRWQHKNRYLWRIHEAHHSPSKVDWLSGSRSHALEILINQTIEFAPIVLLSGSVEVIAYKGVISAVWGMFIHSNIDVNSGKLRFFINGPEMHRWHHSMGKGRNNNFSTKFAIWDWMFGTAFLPDTMKADIYGLKTYFPKNYFSQTIFAFRKFKPFRKNPEKAGIA